MGIRNIDHFQLVVSDIDRAVDFYGRLGLTTKEATTSGPQPRRRVYLKVGGSQEVNLMTPQDVAAQGRQEVPGGGHFCLVWEGTLDEILEHFSRHGLTPRQQPQQGRGSGARGQGTSVFVNDPDSNSVEIIIYP